MKRKKSQRKKFVVQLQQEPGIGISINVRNESHVSQRQRSVGSDEPPWRAHREGTGTRNWHPPPDEILNKKPRSASENAAGVLTCTLMGLSGVDPPGERALPEAGAA